MNQTMGFIIVYLLAATIGLMFSAERCEAGQAAPYTEDAYRRIEKAEKDYNRPKPSHDQTPLEKLKASIENLREVYSLAGYDFDATVRKVACDLKNNPTQVPRDSENVAMMIVVLMSYVKSHCEYEQVNCLDFFDYQTAEAIEWLWKNTGFTP